MGVFFLLLFLIPMPPAGEAPPPYAEESVAAPSYVAPEDNYYQMEDNSSQPSVAHMPEPEEERGAPDCGSAAGGANPNSPPQITTTTPTMAWCSVWRPWMKT